MTYSNITFAWQTTGYTLSVKRLSCSIQRLRLYHPSVSPLFYYQSQSQSHSVWYFYYWRGVTFK